MANDIKVYKPRAMSVELITQAFAKGIINASELRALTAAMREQRLAGGTAQARKNTLEDFLAEAQEPDAGSNPIN
jgi:hypothetical protein